jgi:hypothetical protein
MKNRLIAAAPALALALVAGACDNSGLTDINKDPNNPEFVTAPAILPQATSSTVNRALGSNFNLTMLGLWSQSFAKIQYIDEDRYRLRSTTLDAHWQGFYSGPLEDFQQIIDQGNESGTKNWTAIGTILQQWTFQIVTDAWGDIPYSEALKAETNTSAKYDSQKDVYYGMLAKLTTASNTLDPNGVTFGAEDEIYAGDPAEWRKFANSLRMRMAMRISFVDPAKAKTEFLAAYAAGGFTSNADNAELHYTGSIPSDNPIYSVFHEGQRYDQVVSRTVTDTLRRLNDPRLGIYADPRTHVDTACGGSVYCGWRNGSTTGPASDFTALSPIGHLFKEVPNKPSTMMTYSEVLFLEAEAAARGWIAADPATLYYAGIRASMEQYNVNAGDIATYLAQPSVAYTGLRSIWVQKWIALYGNGPEQYAEMRRTAFYNAATSHVEYIPYITAAPKSSAQRLPFRVPYVSAEQATNNDQVLAAIAANGGSTLYDKRVWWNTISSNGVDITNIR